MTKKEVNITNIVNTGNSGLFSLSSSNVLEKMFNSVPVFSTAGVSQSAVIWYSLTIPQTKVIEIF